MESDSTVSSDGEAHDKLEVEPFRLHADVVAVFDSVDGTEHSKKGAIDQIQALMQMIETDYEAELHKTRSRAEFQCSELDKKLGLMRSASRTETKHIMTAMEDKHREAIAKQQQEFARMQNEYEQKLADQEADHQASELDLKRKISVLSDRAAEAALEQQRHLEHLGRSALRRLHNAHLSTGFETWTYQYLVHKQLAAACSRMRNISLHRMWDRWEMICESRKVHRQRVASVIIRVSRVALTAAYSQWHRDWLIRGRDVHA